MQLGAKQIPSFDLQKHPLIIFANLHIHISGQEDGEKDDGKKKIIYGKEKIQTKGRKWVMCW